MLYEAFGARPAIVSLPDPAPEPHGVVVEVGATGLCRSDWHGWMGHDPDIVPPHVPGHELAGTIVAVGGEVRRWRIGDRVTVPFVAGCGSCGECRSGNQQVCPSQFQPGFTHWGSFAELVSLHYADANLVALPERIDFAAAASLGCRFATSFRAVVDQARVKGGEWVAIYGCGGVGLSAVMIAAALGAQVVAIDIDPDALALALSFGAVATVDAAHCEDVPQAIATLTGGGTHVSIDALGSTATLASAILGLRRRGRHVQVGLLAGADKDPAVPMGRVIGWELEIVGSHGMQAHRYDAMFEMIEAGRLAPERLVSRRITLDDAVEALVDMDRSKHPGATVVTAFKHAWS
jgi:alcohol dehydrogenase